MEIPDNSTSALDAFLKENGLTLKKDLIPSTTFSTAYTFSNGYHFIRISSNDNSISPEALEYVKKSFKEINEKETTQTL